MTMQLLSVTWCGCITQEGMQPPQYQPLSRQHLLLHACCGGVMIRAVVFIPKGLQPLPVSTSTITLCLKRIQHVHWTLPSGR